MLTNILFNIHISLDSGVIIFFFVKYPCQKILKLKYLIVFTEKVNWYPFGRNTFQNT